MIVGYRQRLSGLVAVLANKPVLVLRAIDFSIFIALGCIIAAIITGWLEYRFNKLNDDYAIWHEKAVFLESSTYDTTQTQNKELVAGLFLATWGLYPVFRMLELAQMLPGLVQVGYNLLDVVSKAGFGLLIFAATTQYNATKFTPAAVGAA